MVEIDKSLLVDKMNRPYTQSLFLEIGYSEFAIYTLKEQDHVYEGKTYYSMKQLYLEMEDPTEYEFANKYLLGWNHWMRICDNKVVRKYVDDWRDELEIKLRSKAIREISKSAAAGSYQAAKWLADRGWEQRGAGRPSKEEVERRTNIENRITDDYSADVIRLREVR